MPLEQSPKNILVVDNIDFSFRQAIKGMLEPQYKVTENSAPSFNPEPYRAWPPSLALVGYIGSMNAKDAKLSTIHTIANALQIPVLVTLDQYETQEWAADRFDWGAAGYMTRMLDGPDPLLQAVDHTLHKGLYADSSFAGLLLASTRKLMDVGPQNDSLTLRETAVIKLVGRGFTNRQIGKALFISERTVGNHLGNIYGKLSCQPEPPQNRAMLAVYAQRKRMID